MRARTTNGPSHPGAAWADWLEFEGVWPGKRTGRRNLASGSGPDPFQDGSGRLGTVLLILQRRPDSVRPGSSQADAQPIESLGLLSRSVNERADHREADTAGKLLGKFFGWTLDRSEGPGRPRGASGRHGIANKVICRFPPVKGPAPPTATKFRPGRPLISLGTYDRASAFSGMHLLRFGWSPKMSRRAAIVRAGGPGSGRAEGPRVGGVLRGRREYAGPRSSWAGGGDDPGRAFGPIERLRPAHHAPSLRSNISDFSRGVNFEGCFWNSKPRAIAPESRGRRARGADFEAQIVNGSEDKVG